MLENAVRRSHVLKLGLFARESVKFWRHERASFDLHALVRSFAEWDRSQAPGQSALSESRPWITFAAARAVEEILRPDMRIFEFGSGGSTLFFAQRVASGVSVEHDPGWAARVQNALRAGGYSTTWSVEVHPPLPDPRASGRSPRDLEGYVSEDLRYAGMTFRDYAASIDRFSDTEFDVVFLDGRARPSCFKHARTKVRLGGYLIVDNSDRADYGGIHDALASPAWERRHYHGPGPYSWGFWATTVWRRVG
jgi:predicted O-methyltransferase YrrM